jgi:hypothetical protein
MHISQLAASIPQAARQSPRKVQASGCNDHAWDLWRHRKAQDPEGFNCHVYMHQPVHMPASNRTKPLGPLQQTAPLCHSALLTKYLQLQVSMLTTID